MRILYKMLKLYKILYNIKIVYTKIIAVFQIDFIDSFQLYVCKHQLILLMRYEGICDVASFITVYEQL